MGGVNEERGTYRDAAEHQEVPGYFRGQDRGYTTLADLAHHGDRLEHFHAYAPPESPNEARKGEATAEAVPMHTDAGLFIAIVPSLYAQECDGRARRGGAGADGGRGGGGGAAAAGNGHDDGGGGGGAAAAANGDSTGATGSDPPVAVGGCGDASSPRFAAVPNPDPTSGFYIQRGERGDDSAAEDLARKEAREGANVRAGKGSAGNESTIEGAEAVETSGASSGVAQLDPVTSQSSVVFVIGEGWAEWLSPTMSAKLRPAPHGMRMPGGGD
eukprot:2589314-Pleurochrysis_carterae.AAC.1